VNPKLESGLVNAIVITNNKKLPAINAAGIKKRFEVFCIRIIIELKSQCGKCAHKFLLFSAYRILA